MNIGTQFSSDVYSIPQADGGASPNGSLVNTPPSDPVVMKNQFTVTNRVFYIDISHVNAENISEYMETMKKDLKTSSPVILKLIQEGLWEDFYVPTQESTHIELLHVYHRIESTHE